MNEFLGINETKLSYVCSQCGKYRLETRVIGNELVPKTRRIYCCMCGQYVIADLVKEEINNKSKPKVEDEVSMP